MEIPLRIEEILSAQKAYYATGETLDVPVRLDALRRLRQAVERREDDIVRALHADLGKCPQEAYLTETGLVYRALTYMEKHVKSFSSPRRVRCPLPLFPAKCYIQPSPYGTALIMSPWNYPFLLAFDPLIAALAAGNTAVLKPSNYAPETSAVIAKIISEAFDPSYVAVVQGGREANAELLDLKFDYIFFTGGKNVGRLVLEKAARHLTPVTLELGGKSPCIVDETADIALSARRIVFGKFLNAGQTCVAPDYVLVHNSVQDALLAAIKEEIARQFGVRPLENDSYGKIINEKHFTRLLQLMAGEAIYTGGRFDAHALKIEPTVLTQVTPQSPLMQEEIFGPLLPVLGYTAQSDVFDAVARHPTPLALYLFTKNPDMKKAVTQTVQFGGGCINDTMVHTTNDAFGFGGVGDSGMGSYHGKNGFDTFTHYKSIVDKKTRFDPSVRYRPYSDEKLDFARKFLR